MPKINNFSNYYGRIGEPSPMPQMGFDCGCSNSRSLILKRLRELEDKLRTGLQLDTSDLESIISDKIDVAIERNNEPIIEALETIIDKVDENAENLEIVESKIDALSSIYDTPTSCNCFHTTAPQPDQGCLNSIYCNCKK